MTITYLIIIIYIAFVSLGLSDSLLGSGWPVMQAELGVPSSYAGIISSIITCGTIVSALLSDALTRRFKTGTVTAVSVLLTACALIGFACSDSFVWLCVLAVPYGIGAGAVDAALNNYVAVHFSARSMNWLHCFWGVGAAISPYIMSFCLESGFGWKSGYGGAGTIQLAITVLLFATLPLWKKAERDCVVCAESSEDEACIEAAAGNKSDSSFLRIFKIKDAVLVFIAFFAYCSMEATAGLWASSYLVSKGIEIKTAAAFASLFYIGIAVGRFFNGIIADRAGDKRLIRIGSLVCIAAVILIAVPGFDNVFSIAGLVVLGIGCAPIYPSIIHSTPMLFGKENSQAMIGMQMASAYIGVAIMPPVFGFLAEVTGLVFFPYFLMGFIFLMIVMTELLNCKMKKL